MEKLRKKVNDETEVVGKKNLSSEKHHFQQKCEIEEIKSINCTLNP